MTAPTYLITFRTYGTFLPGEEGTVDRRHNGYGEAFREPGRALVAHAAGLRREAAVLLSEVQRAAVLGALVDVSLERGWFLSAAHVRTNHLHALVLADDAPERVMQYFKVFATRALRAREPARRRWWARHGSTRHLWNEASVEAAVEYVLNGQGRRMAWYRREDGRW